MKLHFQFIDRTHAALSLSNFLKSSRTIRDRNDCLVLAIPRAGVFTADIVSRTLKLPNFDIIIPRKLTDPDNKEHSIGAIMDNDFKILDYDTIGKLFIPKEYLEKEILAQMLEIRRRNFLYRNLRVKYDLSESIGKFKTILLIDDGAATGYTCLIATKWIQKTAELHNYKINDLIIALPIAPKPLIHKLKKECSAKVKVVFQPSITDFHSVEQYHKDFSTVTDAQVIDIMKKRNLYRIDI